MQQYFSLTGNLIQKVLNPGDSPGSSQDHFRLF